MERKTITFSANEQILKKTGGDGSFATHTVSYIDAEFDLGDNWQGYDSIEAVWHMNGLEDIATTLDHDGMCEVPHEMVRQLGYVKVNLVGTTSNGNEVVERLTTFTITALAMTGEARITGGNTVPVTPSQFEQFVALVSDDASKAEASASASAQSASESASSATASEQSASQASGYAQNASESAVRAESAKDDAEDARDEIRAMRAEAVTLPAGSEATASYADGLLSLGIPRGNKGDTGDRGDTGATPNISIGTVSTLEPTEDATATITGTAEQPVLNLGIPQGEQGEVSMAQLYSILPTGEASGTVASFSDGADSVPMPSLKVTLEPIQSGTGTPSPDNIRPISGRTEVVTQRTGKNFLNPSLYKFQTATRNGLTYTVNSDGTISVTGTVTATGGPMLTDYFYLPAGTFTVRTDGFRADNHQAFRCRVHSPQMGMTEFISIFTARYHRVISTSRYIHRLKQAQHHLNLNHTKPTPTPQTSDAQYTAVRSMWRQVSWWSIG